MLNNKNLDFICWRDLNNSGCNCPKCYGCTRKKEYTRSESEEIALKMNKSKYRRTAKAKGYNCPWCESWHVGHDYAYRRNLKKLRSRY